MSTPVSSPRGVPYFVLPPADATPPHSGSSATAAAVTVAATSSLKRYRSDSGSLPPAKKPCIEESSPLSRTSSAPTIAVSQPALVAPDMRAFSLKIHGELQAARKRAIAPDYRPPQACPPKPRPSLSLNRKAEYDALPFIQNARETAVLIQQKLRENGETFTPFELEVAPGRKEQIDRIRFLSDEGQHSVVYLCEVHGKGQWVLKLLKPDILDNHPNEAVAYAANQLYNYSQNCQDQFLRSHVAQHVNFDPHLAEISSCLDLKEYIKTSLKQGFLFAKYIPHEFPIPSEGEPIDQTDQRWLQLKKMLACLVCNDIRRNNVRVTEEGTVMLVDLLEVDRFSVNRNELVGTFTDNPGSQAWLLPDRTDDDF